MNDKCPEPKSLGPYEVGIGERERHQQGIEAWRDGCEIAYEIGEAEDVGWRCYCGGRIREN